MFCRSGAGNAGAAFLFAPVQMHKDITAVFEAVLTAGDFVKFTDNGVTVVEFVQITSEVCGQIANLQTAA